MNKIRILLVDDHPALRMGLALLLNGEPDMAVVGEARSGEEAVEMFAARQPDISLMDLRMGSMSGVHAIQTIRASFPTARIIVLTSYDRDEDVYQSLRAGAMAYLLKETPYEEIASAIRTVHSGRRHFPSRISEKLAERMAMPDLNERELDILRLMSCGLSNKEIAAELSVAVGTVKYYINSILTKLNAEDRTQAVIKGVKRGLVELTEPGP
ncbi:MAG: response regulator transcription factor [Capsulimonadaceae bacterium]|nr:response regulator transcription factor [Capsulimonadaceae bacterium]